MAFVKQILCKQYAAQSNPRPWILYSGYKQRPFRFMKHLDTFRGGEQRTTI